MAHTKPQLIEDLTFKHNPLNLSNVSPDQVVLIGDERVKRIPVKESSEPILDLASEFSQLLFDFDRTHVQKESKSISYGRREVGQRLVTVQACLPSGTRLLIKECYRPMWVQKTFWDGYFSFLEKKFPAWPADQVYEECSKLNAPLDVAPHTTGGAVDLTLINSEGKWLDMGTEFNASPLDTNNATYTNAENISPTAKSNRKLLVDVMTKAGFINYPTEWWHWSYGDKYWALMTGKPYAIYSSQEVE
ncbi:MAG: M15 family metallopeptidase [Pseudobdellovibrionaceae bacterium]